MLGWKTCKCDITDTNELRNQSPTHLKKKGLKTIKIVLFHHFFFLNFRGMGCGLKVRRSLVSYDIYLVYVFQPIPAEHNW